MAKIKTIRLLLLTLLIMVFWCSSFASSQPPSSKKSTVSQASQKKAVTKQKKTPVKKPDVKKTTIKKPVVNKKPGVKKSSHKKSPLKKTTSKKQSVKSKTKHTTSTKKKVTQKKHNIPVMAASEETSLLQKSLYQTLAQTDDHQSASAFAPNFASSFEQRLVGFIHKTVSTLRYSSYKLGGTHFDSSQGVYVVDCSGYVDYSLQEVYPKAYLSLVNSTGVEKPNSLAYYDFFTSLPDDPNDHWDKVDEVDKLEPGDILVFRNKTTRRHSSGGHVMVVMDRPERRGDSYLVSVADSAPSGHSQDTRSAHVSGIGIGTLLLQANPHTGEPAAYSWKVGSRWKNNVNFAMARPVERSESMVN